MSNADVWWIIAAVLAVLAAVVAFTRRAGWLADTLGWSAVAFIILGALAL